MVCGKESLATIVEELVNILIWVLVLVISLIHFGSIGQVVVT
jgi:hypothetical protein